MRRVIAAALVLAGCSFDAPDRSDEAADGLDGLPDDSTDDAVTGDDTIDPPPEVTPACDTPDIRLCVDFDEIEEQRTPDGSGRDHLVSVTETGSVVRTPGELAAAISRFSRIHVSDSPELDLAGPLTLAMFVSTVSWQTAGGDETYLENPGRFQLQLRDSGALRCSVGNTFVESDVGEIGLRASWTHVACTSDGEQLRLYVDGSAVACRAAIPGFGQDQTLGTSIAGGLNGDGESREQFAGGVDNVRVLARVASDNEICALAGADECLTDCELQE